MPHRDTVVNGNGIELSGIAAHLLDFFTYYLTNLVQMRMTWHKLRERVDNGNNRFAKLLMFHTRGHPECSGASHTATFCANTASQLMFHRIFVFV